MLIVKQMDLRSNIKKYFDLAYNGEAVFIPRKQDQNVVIISEEEYRRLQQANRIGSYAMSMNAKKVRINSAKFRMSDSIKAHNLKKLEAIRSLGDNWNGNCAPAFKPSLVARAEDLINELNIQPEVFPTALSTIQLEYDNSRKDHMEIEICEDDFVEVFIVKFNGEEISDTIPATADSINERASNFYG